MSKDKIYLTVFVLLAIALIAGCALQAQQTSKRLSVSEIIVPEEGLKFISEDGKVIAEITADKDGGVMGINNNQREPIAMMGAIKNGGFLIVYDDRGNTVWSKP